MTGLCISGLADVHGDFGAEHRLVTDVGHHRHLDVAGLIPIHRAASGNRADVSVGLGQVFHRHPFGGDDTAVGFNAGVLYEFTPNTRAGVTYHPRVKY